MGGESQVQHCSMIARTAWQLCCLQIDGLGSCRMIVSEIQVGKTVKEGIESTRFAANKKHPRHKAGGTRSAVLFCRSFLLTDTRLSEHDEHSRRLSQGLVEACHPKRSVLRKHLGLFQRLKTKSCKDFSFGSLPTGLTSLDSSYGQSRDSCFSGKFWFANKPFFSHLFQTISEQWRSSRTLILFNDSKLLYFYLYVNKYCWLSINTSYWA